LFCIVSSRNVAAAVCQYWLFVYGSISRCTYWLRTKQKHYLIVLSSCEWFYRSTVLVFLPSYEEYVCTMDTMAECRVIE
jgi:hypothetical protein